MSMAGAAASRAGWSRSRILSAVLAVSLVLNVLFVAGAVWSRIEATAGPRSRPAFRADRRATGSRFGAAGRFRQVHRRDARAPRQGSAASRAVISFRLGRGREAGDERHRSCSIVRGGIWRAAPAQPRDNGANDRISWRRCRPSSAAGLSRSRATAGENRRTAAVRLARSLTWSRTAGRRHRRAPAGYSRGCRGSGRPKR